MPGFGACVVLLTTLIGLAVWKQSEIIVFVNLLPEEPFWEHLKMARDAMRNSYIFAITYDQQEGLPERMMKDVARKLYDLSTTLSEAWNCEDNILKHVNMNWTFIAMCEPFVGMITSESLEINEVPPAEKSMTEETKDNFIKNITTAIQIWQSPPFNLLQFIVRLWADGINAFYMGLKMGATNIQLNCVDVTGVVITVIVAVAALQEYLFHGEELDAYDEDETMKSDSVPGLGIIPWSESEQVDDRQCSTSEEDESSRIEDSLKSSTSEEDESSRIEDSLNTHYVSPYEHQEFNQALLEDDDADVYSEWLMLSKRNTGLGYQELQQIHNCDDRNEVIANSQEILDDEFGCSFPEDQCDSSDNESVCQPSNQDNGDIDNSTWTTEKDEIAQYKICRDDNLINEAELATSVKHTNASIASNFHNDIDIKAETHELGVVADGKMSSEIADNNISTTDQTIEGSLHKDGSSGIDNIICYDKHQVLTAYQVYDDTQPEPPKISKNIFNIASVTEHDLSTDVPLNQQTNDMLYDLINKVYVVNSKMNTVQPTEKFPTESDTSSDLQYEILAHQQDNLDHKDLTESTYTANLKPCNICDKPINVLCMDNDIENNRKTYVVNQPARSMKLQVPEHIDYKQKTHVSDHCDTTEMMQSNASKVTIKDMEEIGNNTIKVYPFGQDINSQKIVKIKETSNECSMPVDMHTSPSLEDCHTIPDVNDEKLIKAEQTLTQDGVAENSYRLNCQCDVDNEDKTEETRLRSTNAVSDIPSYTVADDLQRSVQSTSMNMFNVQHLNLQLSQATVKCKCTKRNTDDDKNCTYEEWLQQNHFLG